MIKFYNKLRELVDTPNLVFLKFKILMHLLIYCNSQCTCCVNMYRNLIDCRGIIWDQYNRDTHSSKTRGLLIDSHFLLCWEGGAIEAKFPWYLKSAFAVINYSSYIFFKYLWLNKNNILLYFKYNYINKHS